MDDERTLQRNFIMADGARLDVGALAQYDLRIDAWKATGTSDSLKNWAHLEFAAALDRATTKNLDLFAIHGSNCR